MTSRYSLYIYDTTNTTKQHIVSSYALTKGMIVEELNGEDYIEFEVDLRDASWSNLAVRKIVRLVDNNPVPVTYRSFRVVSMVDARDEENKLIGKVRAEHIKYDLSQQIHNAAEEIISQTPTTHLTKILTGSGFTVGTVTPTALVTIPYAYNSRLADLEQVRAATGYDLVVNEDLSVDLIDRGSATDAAIRYRKNMLSIRRTLDRVSANIMYGVGGEGNIKQIMTISEATHRVTNIATLTVTLDSDKVVSSADSLNGFYVEKPDGSFLQITDCNKQVGANDQLILDSVSGLSVGDAIKIRTSNSATARLEYIPDAASRAVYGDAEGVFRDESIQEIRNLVGPHASSAFSGTYTSGLCEGWTEVGDPTTMENTDADFIKYGTKSQKVAVAAIAAPSNAPTVATGAAGALTGDYKYKKTWRSVDGETTVSPESATVSPSGEKVDVGRNETVPDHIDSWRLYRTKDGESTFYFNADIPAGTSNYTDDKPDSELTLEPPSENTAAGGQGIQRTFTAVTDKEYAAMVWCFVEAGGRVRVEIEGGTNVFPSTTLDRAKVATPTRAIDTLFVITLQGLVSNGTDGKIKIMAHRGAATFYADAAMVVENAYAPSEGVFIADNSATTLWHKTYDSLQEAKNPVTTYDVQGLDLFEYDQAGFADDQIQVGDTITVADEDLTVEAELKCTKKNTNMLEPYRCTFELSHQPRKLSEFINGLLDSDAMAARAIFNRAIRLTQQISLERGTSGRPTIEIAELT